MSTQSTRAAAHPRGAADDLLDLDQWRKLAGNLDRQAVLARPQRGC